MQYFKDGLNDNTGNYIIKQIQQDKESSWWGCGSWHIVASISLQVSNIL